MRSLGFLFRNFLGFASLLILSACAKDVPASPAVVAAPNAVKVQQEGATEVGPAQDGAASVAAGKQLYTSYCARCHGVDMVNLGTSFDLRQFPLGERARFDHSVTYGLRAMPAWASLLKSGDLQNLWAYVTNGRRAE